MTGMRRFQLYRKRDISGVSGTGIVAEGVLFGNGSVALRWLTNGVHSIVIHQNVQAMMKVHGHNGATIIHWIDEQETSTFTNQGVSNE